MFKVKQSDCRTGWMVVNYAGRVLEREPIYRRREAADERCARLNNPHTEHFHDCTRCGQTVITRAAVPMCDTCKRLEREPQGEAMQLFAPAPNQIPGQLGF